VKGFEKAYPNIKVHVNNIGAGPTEYTKLQTALKRTSYPTFSVLRSYDTPRGSRIEDENDDEEGD
jgi:hypothetical protein